jgi:hypothetical protein
MRETRKLLLLAALVWLLPAIASAQATLTGTVKDSSGSVLPGVTVELTAPAQQPRSVVTDSAGVYRIIELSPGTYTVTYSLPGFSTVRREGVQLGGTQVMTIPIDLKVGALQETVTVTGETPVVDVQSVKHETVLDSETIESVPGARTVGTLLNATPGLTVDGNGAVATPTMTFFSARGGQTNEGRMTVNGLTVAAAFNGGGVSSYILDTVNADETSVVVSGGMGESDTGGPVMNIVPRAGGNTFRGQVFASYANEKMRSDNLTDALKAPPISITETPGIINAYDSSFTYSGPIKKDRIWFLGSYRKLNTQTAVEGIVANANAGDLSRWDWVRDDSLPARLSQGRAMYQMRASAQVTDKNRVNFSHEYQTRCEGAGLKRETTSACYTRGQNWIATGVGTTTSPEASTSYIDFPYWLTQATWTNPLTNRILLEAGYSRLSYDHAGGPGQLPPDGILNIGVTESSATINPATGAPYAPRANYGYRALSQYADNWSNPNHWRVSASYVTGTHNMKLGYQGSYLINNTNRVRNDSLMSYAFNRGNPTSFSVAIPEWRTADRTRTSAIFVQDTWTRNRLTLQGALRYDRASSFSPGSAELNGTPVTSALNLQPIAFERTKSVDAFNDFTPRFGVAYDVFGNGRTAVKFNMGHYLDAATNDSAYTRNNPANRIVSTYANRGWTDNDADKVVDCNPLNLGAQGPTQPVGPNRTVDTCVALTGNNLNFGGTSGTLTTVNPATLRGWGVRENDWQWGLTVQQELLPRLSVEVGYARRWFQGVTVTDNLNDDPSQYTSYIVPVPLDPRLPGGGGYNITRYQRSNAGLALAANNNITFQTDFGPEETNYWHGVDVTLNARTRWGLVFSGGTSTGRAVNDDCATRNIDSPDPRNCHDADPFQTTFRGLASYTIPWADVRVSATLRSQPQVERTATWNLPNSPASAACLPNPAQCVTLQGLLGYLPQGTSTTGTQSINLLDNDHRLYDGQRRTQVDMRFAKIVRFRNTRADLGVDLWNLFNTNYATGYENSYEYSIGNALQGNTWNNPSTIYAPRYARLNLTFSF